MAKISFDVWMEQVDMHFLHTTGLGRDDFADNLYHDMWEEGHSAHSAMVDTIEREYGEEGLEAFGLEI